ncbi:MAG: hypothetical protein K6U74_06915, partial [Firmicutes bacterium]|nr:hypothetical protein [Bacillota bacterium]
MEVWYCNDNGADSETVARKLSKYRLRVLKAREAEEKLNGAEQPAALLAHTTDGPVLEKASKAGVPTVALVDGYSEVEDLRSVGAYVSEVTDVDNLEKSLEKVLTDKVYD